MEKSMKVLSTISIATILFIGILVIATTSALDPTSRFYGEWEVVDGGEEMNLLGSASPVGFFFTFEPDGDFLLTVKEYGQPIGTIYGTYTVISSTSMSITISGESLETFTYSFSNSDRLTLIDASGTYLVLNKIRDL
jgi:hypothetical protein